MDYLFNLGFEAKLVDFRITASNEQVEADWRPKAITKLIQGPLFFHMNKRNRQHPCWTSQLLDIYKS